MSQLKIKYWNNLITLFAIFHLIGCSSVPQSIEEIQPRTESTIELVDELLRRADLNSGDAAAELRLEAISILLDTGLIARAATEAGKIQDYDSLFTESKFNLALLKAKIAIAENQDDIALNNLTDSLTNSVDENSQLGQEILLLRGQLYLRENQPELAIENFVKVTEFWPSEIETTLYEDLWSALTILDENGLGAIAQNATSYELRGWIELARVFKTDEHSIRSQLDSIAQWRRIWAQHSAAARLPKPLSQMQEAWANRPINIALILPVKRPAGNAIQEGFFSAYYQELGISREVPRISVYDSTGIDQIYEIYNTAVENGADLIIGPLNKNLVNQLQELDELPVMTLALNYADGENSSQNLFQFGLAPEDEITEVIDLAWKTGQRNAAVLMPDIISYRELEKFFVESWLNKGGKVVSRVNFSGNSGYAETVKQLMAIDSSESRAEKLLSLLPRRNMEFTPRRRTDIDFIFLVASPLQGRQINPTLAFYFADDIPVYSMPSIYEGEDNQILNRDLNGIVFLDAPWILDPEDKLNQSINETLRQTQGSLKRLRAMGIDSFRLYARLQQFYNNENLYLKGATGLLTISKNRKIYRDLEAAQFIDGIATPLAP